MTLNMYEVNVWKFVPMLVVVLLPYDSIAYEQQSTSHHAETSSPEAWMVIPAKKVMSLDSTKPGPVDASIAKPGQSTPWVHVDGLLRGNPTSPEEQAKKKSHNGAAPRLIFVTTPSEYLAQLSIRFIGGEKSGENVRPLIDLGHHVCALTLGGDKGAQLTINRHSLLVAQGKDFRLEYGKTYKFQIEVKGAEMLVRIKDGPTLYAKNEFLEGKKRTIGLTGATQGTIEIDEFSIWSVKDAVQEGWSQRRDNLSTMKPVQLKEPPAKKKNKKARNSKQGAAPSNS
jgi:hypothetical protein